MALPTQADLPASKDLVRQLRRDTPAPRPLAHRQAPAAKFCANVFNSTNVYDVGHDDQLCSEKVGRCTNV